MNISPSFLPYGRQNISEDDILAVSDVLRSSFLTQGPMVPRFESAVASKVCAKYGIAVNSATSALHIACLALGVGPGDSVWTSPITFVASANCALYCGANIDFVDIEPNTGLMSIAALEDKLEHAKHTGTLPKVVVPVHLAGSSCDMASLASLAEFYGFHILEDASHAIGGLYRDTYVGSCVYSSISVFSFHPVKILTTGEGGLATTNDPLLAQRLRELSSHGIVRDPERFEYEPPGPWAYEQQSLGFNYRLTDLQAALGLSQLDRLEFFVSERNMLYQVYQDLLYDLPFSLLDIPQYVTSSLHLAIIRLPVSDPLLHKRLFLAFRNANIGVQIHYIPVHLQPHYRHFGFREGQFPNSESYASSAISLPMFPGLTLLDQHRVIDILIGFASLNSL